MLCLSCIFLWLVAGERIKGFNISDCPTKKILWMYSARSEEEFVLFCDFPEPQKSHSSHKCQPSLTQTPEPLPCGGREDLADVRWYLQPQNGDPLKEITKGYPYIIQENSSLRFSAPEMSITGSYICRPGIRSPQDVACCVRTVLEVKPQTNTSCKDVSHKQDLRFGSLGQIHCPSLSCQDDAQSPEVTWYKDGKLLSDKRSSPILVDEVFKCDEGTYVCDHTRSDNASTWTVRAVVQVRAIGWGEESRGSEIDDAGEREFRGPRPFTGKWPESDCTAQGEQDTLEVELGKPLTLNCTARFGFEKNFQPVLKWYIKDSDLEREVTLPKGKSIKSTPDGDIVQLAFPLEKVTQTHLRSKFVCFAQNSIGNTTRSIQLTLKKGVVLLFILLGTVAGLASVLAGSALLYWYWIEIVLFYRTYRSKDETLGDKKEFDAFISYAKWSSFESETTSSLTEEHLALNLFPEVLENKYGYTLCLLERDVAPGGAYAEDIVSIIKKSRRGIFILSPSYVSGPSVFELQAAVNLALADRTLKLILIKFCPFPEPESLPHLVRKALRVLPIVTWRGLKSVTPSSRFWTQMRYHMPVKTSKGLT
ncbi:interleukin-18 receptor accessory protein [Tupaia chinensis]|uniref:interleukin-18 receptor accessory protein n=1 Tax=Tupaia chinensis TaxID=246437 RepID=UPI000FFC95A2|nr:interleukin-18 receptor accessory protein [Tupaia chinensis]